MKSRYPPVLTLFLCIALVIMLLPLIGATGPVAATRGFIHGTITAADYAPNSPPIRGITVFIARPDGSSPFTLRTNESGMYRTGILDDRGVGFTVSVNSPDRSAYNPRYESASAENVRFTVNDPDGEIRNFALHGSAASTATPTATPTPTATTTTIPMTPTAIPTATPTPDESLNEEDGGYAPDSPASSGKIYGVVHKDNSLSGPGINDITVFVWRRDSGWSNTYTTYNHDGIDGYYDTGTIPDPNNAGFQVVANKADQRGYKSQYTTSAEKTVYVSSSPTKADLMIRLQSTPAPSTTVKITGTVVDMKGNKLGGIPVFFWRQDGGKAFSVKTSSDSSTLGTFSADVEKYTGSCGAGTRCYNIMANKWDDASRSPAWFNSTEQTNIKPDGNKNLYFRLPTSKVTFSGRVYDESGKGVNGIDVLLWRHDGQASYATTRNIGGTDGKWAIELPRSVWTSNPDHRYNILANKNVAGHYNDAYTTSTEVQNVLPGEDKSWGLDFRIESRFVTLGGKVTDSSGNGIPGIFVYFWRQDGGQSFYAMTGASGQYTSQGIARVEKFSGSCGTGSKCFNIAFNKDNNDPSHAKKPDYETREQSNIRPSYNQGNINQQLGSGSVTFSGKVTNTTHSSGVPGIWVSGRRLDNRASFLVQTDGQGMWSAKVEKFSEPDHRFVVVANPSERRNSFYLNSTPEVKQPSWDQRINPVLVVSRVTFSGRIYLSGATAGNYPIIPITFERDDRAVTRYVNTRSDGTFSIQLDGCTSRYCTYTVTANKGGPGYPKNTLYNTPNPITGRWSDRDQTSLSFTLTGPVPTPSPTPNPNPTPPVTPTPTPTPGSISLTVDAVEMVSPDELGIAVKVTFPASVPQGTKREITIASTINGKAVSKTFDVTSLTTPGREWGGEYSRTENGKTRVKPYTPLRINLRDAQVPRFTGDTDVTVSVSARYQGVSSRTMQRTGTVLLPVIFYHGYLDPKIRSWLEVVEIAAYRPMSDFLVANGYNKADTWTGDDATELSRKGYSVRRYLTLMDPDMGVTYTTAEEATPDILRRDVDRTVNNAISSSYANRVNLIGHSTGGLVSFFYASVEPSRVARVITVGTPHQGVSEIYNKAFAPEIRSRQEAEELLKVQDGTYKGQENTIKWFMPKYSDALQLPPDYVAGRDPNPYFTSTFTFSASSQVDYHYIYSSSHDDTLQTLVLEKNADGRWYHVKETKTGAGDHTVLAKSASNQGVSGINIHKWPVNIWYRHAVMFRESSVHTAVLTALRHQRTMLRDETVIDTVVMTPAVTIGTLEIATPTPTFIAVTG